MPEFVVEPLGLAAVIGAVGTFITAVLTRANWSSNAKRWVAIGVVVALTVVALLVYQFPDQWQVVAGALAIAVGASQFVYTLLKPTGVLDFIQVSTTPAGARSDDVYAPQHAASTDSSATPHIPYLDN